MSFLDTLKGYEKDAILDLIRGAGIREYGAENEDLASKIQKVLEENSGEEMIAAGGLNNHDFSGMLLKIVKEDAQKVLNGLEAIAYVTGAARKILYLPEEETELAESLKKEIESQGLAIEVENDIVNARLLRDGITCHVETLAAVADAVEGKYQAQTLISVVRYTDSETAEEVKAPACVPFGTSVKELVGDLEGVKAVQVGEVLYLPEEVEGLVLTAELALCDGVIRVYTEGCCLLDTAVKKLLASRKKSCGKCTFCREGLLQLYTRMKEIVEGKGDPSSPAIMEEIGSVMAFSGSCTLGNCGSAFVLETIRKFENEYTDHIKKRKCTAGTCTAFINMYIDPAKCSGCGKCIPACAEDLIEGLPGYIHMIEDVDCTKCGKCMGSCPEGAIVRTTDRVPRIPDRLTRVGRFKRY